MNYDPDYESAVYDANLSSAALDIHRGKCLSRGDAKLVCRIAERWGVMPSKALERAEAYLAEYRALKRRRY